MNVAMIGSKHYQNSRKIKETLTALRGKFLDDLLVISGGGRHGADAMVKKYAIEFGIDYKDFVFSYNYSYQFGDVNFGSGGFHQITIGFNFLRGSIECDCF